MRNTTRFVFATAALFATAAGMVAPAAAGDYRDFSVRNRNNQATIIGLWYARAGTNEPWRPVDLDGVIRPGEAYRISVNMPVGYNVFDFKVRFNDGYVATAGNVDLSRVSVLNAD